MSEVTTLPAFYLPGLKESDFAQFVPLEFGSNGIKVKMHAPVLTPELLKKTIASLRKAREEYLVKKPVFEIAETIGKVLELWSDPQYPPRKLAEKLLPVITGFSSPMIQLTLGGIMSRYSPKNLKLLLEDEFEDPRVLDEFRPRKRAGGFIRAHGPALTTVILAGNAPGISMENTILGLLMKSAVLAKSSSDEPLFAALFAQSIAEIDPMLAQCVAMLLWKGGSEEIERLAFGQSDAVIVYGSEHSVNEVRKRVPPGVRLVTYGHKLSFGVIGREALSAAKVKETAEYAAVNVSMMDQQGCVSPHVFYVEEGGEASAREFARFLALEMESFNVQVPRGQISGAEAAHINSLRGSYEFRELTSDDVNLFTSSPGTDWTVIYEKDPAFVPSCLNRTIRVKPVDDAMDIVRLVTPIKQYLQTMGAALPRERLMPLAEKMAGLGIDRIPRLGAMAGPSLLWRHDGRFNLLDLIRWTGIEE